MALKPYDLIGIGIGPFNLSLAALLEKAPELTSVFLERKPSFDWHPEVMFEDSLMQTSYLKDLVTPVDPTSPYSFLNHLVDRNLFYQFLNTQRGTIARREFEQYCAWVSQKLAHKLQFETAVSAVSFDGGLFQVQTARGLLQSRSICIGTGLVPRIPECVEPHLGPRVFHAKSPELKNVNLEGKSVVIIGGGQTGIEVFRNALLGKWGHPGSLRLVTRRKSLEPLDESPFTNDYFTPAYVDAFWGLTLDKKAQIVASQKLASDGNTPNYLLDLYNDLYRLKHVEGDTREIRILAYRKLVALSKTGSENYTLKLENAFYDQTEEMRADVVILSTGFQNAIPSILDPIRGRIAFDHEGRFQFKKCYDIRWDGPPENKIYALNFSRHNHGIIDPQTSLMAWRSAVVINDLAQRPLYKTESSPANFVDYGTKETRS